MSVKEQLATLVNIDAIDARSRQVRSLTTADGRRWLLATNGHALAMVISDEEAESGTFAAALVEAPRKRAGSIDATELRSWAGEPVRIPCVECLDGRCARCKVGPCDECKGTRFVTVWRDPRPGEIADRVLNRDLVFRTLQAVGQIEGIVEITASEEVYGAVWFEQPDWRIAVMPLHSNERGPMLEIQGK